MHSEVARSELLGPKGRWPARKSRPSLCAPVLSTARALPVLLLVLVGCTNPDDGGPQDGQDTPDACASCGPGSDAGTDAGTDAGVDGGTHVCVPRTCASVGDACGPLSDGCNGTITCGCASPLTCGARKPGTCGYPNTNPVCNASGWCWENPLPFGMNLLDVWGSSSSDLWAVGSGGTLLRSDGTTWRAVNAGTDKNLSGLWGTAANNVWVVGDNYVQVYDGVSQRTPLGAPSDLLRADVGGSSASDVWVIGEFGTTELNRFNGVAWTGYTNPVFFAPESVYAASPNQAWAVGFSDTALQWDGASWTQIQLPKQTNYDVWGSSASDVWVAGRAGVCHWNGASWSASYDTFAEEAYAVHGTGPGDVWVGTEKGLLHYDGQAWTRRESGSATRGLWALSSSDIWAVGGSGSILHWEGSNWARQSGFGPVPRLGAMWTNSDDDVWFLGESALRYHNGYVESFGKLASIQWYDKTDAWGSSANDIWYTAPRATMFHWDGTLWSSMTLPLPNSSTAIRAVWGTSPTNVYAVTEASDPFEPSNAYVVHWDGTRWAVAQPILEGSGGTFGVDLNAVAGTSANDVWVGADNGALWHFDGTTWTQSGSINTSVNDFWVSPTGTLWAATNGGVYRRPSNGAWARVSSSPNQALGHIAGSSDTNIWVTEGNLLNPTPIIYQYDGTHWTRQNTGAGQGVVAISASDTRAWVAGDSGGVLRKQLP